ncbi:phosphoglucan phosphatase LSF2, chloroplastic [Apium graveolens]|uniref:phosphoglucan phosphatase LSF2, chloroplastic n=1 Tax=Apium graveolens TaxID=4045 RepID=UPI003D7B50D2
MKTEASTLLHTYAVSPTALLLPYPKSCNMVYGSRISTSSKMHKVVCQSAAGRGGETTNKTTSSSNRVDEYNTAMKRLMRNPYEYHHDLGMNYTLISENLIVGSQPQKAEDIDHLKEEENVAYILNLQQDKDIEYWGIYLPAVVNRCQRNGIRHMRRPAKDFDGNSLRVGLPKAVSSLEWAISEGKGRVYVHCTAGLGRAPAVAIAYMFWFCDMDLNTAYNLLTSKRPCGPNKRAVQGATYDLVKDNPWEEPFEILSKNAFEDIADWERKKVQDCVRSLRGT